MNTMLFTNTFSHRRQAQRGNLPQAHAADRDGYKYPEFALLQLRGVGPENEINAKVMAVVESGRTMGTTVGLVNGLKSLVRHSNLDPRAHHCPLRRQRAWRWPYRQPAHRRLWPDQRN